MERESDDEDALALLLAELREARVARGLRCPHCDGGHLQRWGRFAHRQRYRCNACRRTFSDLTGTPAAYSKKLLLWVPYGRCLAHGMSVRRTARFVGLHPCTAFRWRHALLDALRARDRENVCGQIQLGTLWFHYSEKGKRRLGRPPRRRVLRHARTLPDRVPGANVLAACDADGHVVTTITSVSSSRLIRRDELERALSGRIEVPPKPVLIADFRRFSPGTFWPRPGQIPALEPRRSPVRGRRARGSLHAVESYCHRFVEWMHRFFGVATRYLRNYLVWHRGVDRRGRQDRDAGPLRWPVGAVFS